MIKLQASSRLQLTAAKVDAQPLREALLETAELFANAVEFLEARQLRQAKADMLRAVRAVAQGVKKTLGKSVASIEPTVELETGQGRGPSMRGGLEATLRSPTDGKIFKLSWEYLLEDDRNEASAWVKFDSPSSYGGKIFHYKGNLSKGVSVEQYRAVMNNAMDVFEKTGFSE